MKNRTLWIMFCHNETALVKDQTEMLRKHIKKIVWVKFLSNHIKIKSNLKKSCEANRLFLFNVDQHFLSFLVFSLNPKVMLLNWRICLLPTQQLWMVKALRNSFRPLTPSVFGSWLQFIGKFKRLILHFAPVDSQSDFPITSCDDNSNITWCISISQSEEIGQSPGLDTALRWI